MATNKSYKLKSTGAPKVKATKSNAAPKPVGKTSRPGTMHVGSSAGNGMPAAC
jgi:hypothetical protein